MRIKKGRLAGIGALAGFVTLAIVLAALFLGLWLDSRLGQRGPLTVLLLVLSVPISLTILVRIALGSVKYVTETVDTPADEKSEEEA